MYFSKACVFSALLQCIFMTFQGCFQEHFLFSDHLAVQLGKVFAVSSILSGSILYSFIDTIIDSSLKRKKYSVAFIVFTYFSLTVTASSERHHLQIFFLLEYSLETWVSSPSPKLPFFLSNPLFSQSL